MVLHRLDRGPGLESLAIIGQEHTVCFGNKRNLQCKLVSKLVSYLLANLRLICRLCTQSIFSKNECQTVFRAMLSHGVIVKNKTISRFCFCDIRNKQCLKSRLIHLPQALFQACFVSDVLPYYSFII